MSWTSSGILIIPDPKLTDDLPQWLHVDNKIGGRGENGQSTEVPHLTGAGLGGRGKNPLQNYIMAEMKRKCIFRTSLKFIIFIISEDGGVNVVRQSGFLLLLLILIMKKNKRKMLNPMSNLKHRQTQFAYKGYNSRSGRTTRFLSLPECNQMGFQGESYSTGQVLKLKRHISPIPKHHRI